MTNQPNLPDFEPNGQKPCSTEFAGKPMFQVPKDATPEIRARMLREYLDRLDAANRHLEGSPVDYVRRLFTKRNHQR